MVKLALILALLLCPSISKAEDLHLSDTVLDTLNKLPETKHGAYWSFIDHGINYSTQIAILEHKGFSLNLGVAGDSDKTNWKAVSSIGYDFGKLKDYGVNVPIVKYIGFEPYVAAGYGNINFKEMGEGEFDAGVGVNILSLKF